MLDDVHTPRWWYVLVVAFLSSILTAGAALWLSVRFIQASERKWCELVTTLDEGYRTPPGPSTPLGQKIARDVAGLRESFHCR